ncbi:MAG: DUF58 domain-containing protein [Lachnospiraceae bacterium]|nr:DUF58 domain-containing protein [Lachnospiraceae bacterium]
MRKFLMFLAIIGAGIIVGRKGGIIPYTIFYATLLVPVLCFLYVFYVHCRFRIYQYMDQLTVIKEQVVPYQFVLANEDFLTYSYVKVTFLTDKSEVEAMDLNKSYCLLPGEKIDKKTTIRCRYRGQYTVGINSVITKDFFHLFTIIYPCPSYIKVTVNPRIVDIRELAAAPKQFDEKKRKWDLSADLIPDAEVRQYQEGDALKRVNWKASAREGRLLVRKYVDEPKTEVVLICDFHKEETEELKSLIYEDKMIETGIALANYFCLAGIPLYAGICATEEKQFAIYEKQDFETFYYLCCHTVFSEKDSLSKFVRALMGLQGGTHYIFVTGSLAQAKRECFRFALQLGIDVTVVLIRREVTKEERDAIDPRIHLYEIDPEQDIREVLEAS